MQHATSTKEQLVANAERLVHQRGFAATSVNDVLTATGVTKGALYHHFPGKDELASAVLERARVSFLGWLDEVLAGSSPQGSLERFFAAVLEHHQKTEFVGGCLFGNVALEVSDTHRGQAAEVDEVFKAWASKLERVLRAGQSAGCIRSDIAAAELAQVTVATVEGGIMLSRLRKNEQPLKVCLDSLRVFLMATVKPAEEPSR